MVCDSPPQQLIYFSSRSGNTRRFVDKLAWPAQAIGPAASPLLQVDSPYILVLPTYGGGQLAGAVPKPVIRFLNHAGNRAQLRGVVAGGNTNFGAAFALAGKIIARKCQVPLLHCFELLGTEADILAVEQGVRACWPTLN